MSKYIKWVKYDEPKVVEQPWLRRPHVITGEWECNHPAIEMYWQVGYLIGDEKEARCRAMFMLKDGTRHEFRKFDDSFEAEDAYLDSLK